MRGPVSADMVPDWHEQDAQALARWWQSMVERHLAFHPDDAPESVISFLDGRPLFSSAACEKLRQILDAMFREHGGLVYQVAELCVMTSLETQTTA